MTTRLVMTLLVRDEADIITSVLDYHLAEGVSRIIVTDNGSVDGTLDVLRDYERHNLIDLLIEPPGDYSQHRWVTRMARLAHDRYGATWVINADADEFFIWRGGRLIDAFGSVPETVNRLLVTRHDFVSIDRPAVQAPPLEMTYRKAVSVNRDGAPLPPKVIHRGDAEVTVEQGNHQANAPSFRAPPALGPIEVMHYPVRSYAQFETKVRNAGSGYAANKELPENKGAHMRRRYELLRSGDLEREYRLYWFYDDRCLKAALSVGHLVQDRAVAERLAT